MNEHKKVAEEILRQYLPVPGQIIPVKKDFPVTGLLAVLQEVVAAIQEALEDDGVIDFGEIMQIIWVAGQAIWLYIFLGGER